MDTSIDLYAEISKADAEKKATISKVNGVVALLDEMNEEDRTSLLKALHDHSIDGTVIFNVLQKNGWNISYDQVRRFRNGSCRTPDRYKKSGE